LSKKKKEFSLDNYTDLEIVKLIEKKWGDEVSHIAPLDETTKDGKKQFYCIDLGLESTLTVDDEGWAFVRPNNGGFGDTLGTIK